MTPKQYIQIQLEKLKEFKPREIPKENLADEIYRLVMSKKFRKYSANEGLQNHIKNAIKWSVENNQPIKLVFPHGAYKLWRLEEAPLPDWAELFAAMYYTKWLKPICEIYEPGVWFDFYAMDFIIPRINNIPEENVEAYKKEYQKVLDFLKDYQSVNLKMTVTPASSQFSSKEEYEKTLQEYIEKLTKEEFVTAESELNTVELNVNTTSDQIKDPKWKEKVLLVHDAYLTMERAGNYYYDETKIPVTPQAGGSGRLLAVGTTKTSIVKFWIGAGVLEKQGDSYIESIFSPKQLDSAKIEKELINLPGLDSANFQRVKIVVE